MHMQPIYRNNVFVTTQGVSRGMSNAYIDEGVVIDNGKMVYGRGLCLPSDNKMTEEQQDRIQIVDLLHTFHDQPQNLIMPAIPNGSFEKKLYSMYLSYLPKEKIAFDLKMNCDDRGSFTELLKTTDHGQFSVNISKPGITKGQHWHNTNALADKPLPVYGEGLNVRDWLYVEDHCKAIDLILQKGRVGEVYNIGGHNEMRNIDIVKLICKELGKPESLITYVADRKGHDMRYAIDPNKIHSELGWLPETMFAEGLKRRSGGIWIIKTGGEKSSAGNIRSIMKKCMETGDSLNLGYSA